MILIDTDVMVDVLRGHAPAACWLAELGSEEEVGIPGLVAMELLQGCRNSEEQRKVEKVLRPHVLHWPEQADCLRAYDDYLTFRLSHNVGILDALIAETAVGLGARLATFNNSHYRVITALQTIQPYARTRSVGLDGMD